MDQLRKRQANEILSLKTSVAEQHAVIAQLRTEKQQLEQMLQGAMSLLSDCSCLEALTFPYDTSAVEYNSIFTL